MEDDKNIKCRVAFEYQNSLYNRSISLLSWNNGVHCLFIFLSILALCAILGLNQMLWSNYCNLVSLNYFPGACSLSMVSQLPWNKNMVVNQASNVQVISCPFSWKGYHFLSTMQEAYSTCTHHVIKQLLSDLLLNQETIPPPPHPPTHPAYNNLISTSFLDINYFPMVSYCW